ncbi:MAG: energy transducer TonB [Flavobacteriaceae bacterium]
MRVTVLSFVLLFSVQFLNAQKLNFNVCNDISEVDLRDKCLKYSLDNLFVKKLLEIRLEMKDGLDSQIDVSFDVEVSRVGLFSLRNFESNNQEVYEAFNQIVYNITPLSSYKHKNKLVSSTLSFDYSLRLLENSTLEILQNNIRIYSNKRPFEKKEKIEFPEIINETANSTPKEKEVNAPFAVVENVPVFPGCDLLQNNAELKDCMSDNITSFLISNFNTDVATKLNIPDGRVRIKAEFIINTYGYVVDVTASTPYPELENEAMRVINSLPKFEPGKQKGEEVNVCFSLPIVFQVESDDKTKKQ